MTDELDDRVPVRTYLARLTPVTMVYLGAAWIGLQYASIGSSVSLVWPATGIAIAALVLFGPRYWPGIALGAFLANATTDVSLAAAGAIAFGNTLEALIAAHILRRQAGPRPKLDDVSHVRSLVLVAAPIGAAVSACIGTLALFFTGVIQARAVPLTAGMWWAGDLLGAFVIAPLFFTSQRRDRTPRRKFIEATLLCIGTATAIQLGVAQARPGSVLQQVDYHYLLFPFVIWAALRFGARGAAAMTLTVSAVSVWRALHTGEPFNSPSSNATLLGVASYLAVVAVTGLLLAASLRWERDKAARALQQSEERLRLAVDAARLGIWYWAVDSDTLSWDDNLRALFGLEPGTPVDGYEGFLRRVHPDDRPWVDTTVRQVLASGDRLNFEFRVVVPDGSVRWVADQSRVARDEAGKPLYITGVCMDATERRRSEERLRQAHRMDSLGRLAGGVAHEANNQMSVVLGAAHFVLRRSDLPADVRTDVEYIRKAAERTAAVTAQLLAFSRRQLLMPVLLDVNAVIRAWEPVLRRVMGEDCPVTFVLGDVASVRADPGQLEQVLLNLALNARDAMPHGGTLTIETQTADFQHTYAPERPGVPIRPGSYVTVEVRDTGHGMDRDTLSHIFEPFFTTKSVGQGTGLGLSTVYGIVKQSNGYVWARSEPGVGTTFTVCLPVSAEPEDVEGLAPEPPSARRSGERILVVEDEDIVRSILRRTLEEAGYSVAEAGTAADALSWIGANSSAVDLLITDLVMPEMGGRDLAAAILELCPRTPVLFISGYTDRDIARRGQLPPGAAFLQKPVTPEALVSAVRESLDRATARS